MTKGINSCGDGNCYFTPERTFRSFTSYYLYRSIKTHKVYEIYALAKLYPKSACIEEQYLIMVALKKKYGDEEVLEGDDVYLTPIVINQGHRSVMTYCTASNTLFIRYRDYQLTAIENAEKDSIKAEERRKILEEMDAADI